MGPTRCAALVCAMIAGLSPGISSAATCSTDFKTEDYSAQLMNCDCFKTSPHGTRIYKVDRYDIRDKTLTETLSPEAVFWCENDGLHVFDPTSLTRERIADSATVVFVRRANEEATQPNTERDALMQRRVKDGYAVLDRIL